MRPHRKSSQTATQSSSHCRSHSHLSASPQASSLHRAGALCLTQRRVVTAGDRLLQAALSQPMGTPGAPRPLQLTSPTQTRGVLKQQAPMLLLLRATQLQLGRQTRVATQGTMLQSRPKACSPEAATRMAAGAGGWAEEGGVLAATGVAATGHSLQTFHTGLEAQKQARPVLRGMGLVAGAEAGAAAVAAARETSPPPTSSSGCRSGVAAQAATKAGGNLLRWQMHQQLPAQLSPGRLRPAGQTALSGSHSAGAAATAGDVASMQAAGEVAGQAGEAGQAGRYQQRMVRGSSHRLSQAAAIPAERAAAMQALLKTSQTQMLRSRIAGGAVVPGVAGAVGALQCQRPHPRLMQTLGVLQIQALPQRARGRRHSAAGAAGQAGAAGAWRQTLLTAKAERVGVGHVVGVAALARAGQQQQPTAV